MPPIRVYLVFAIRGAILWGSQRSFWVIAASISGGKRWRDKRAGIGHPAKRESFAIGMGAPGRIIDSRLRWQPRPSPRAFRSKRSIRWPNTSGSSRPPRRQRLRSRSIAHSLHSRRRQPRPPFHNWRGCRPPFHALSPLSRRRRHRIRLARLPLGRQLRWRLLSPPRPQGPRLIAKHSRSPRPRRRLTRSHPTAKRSSVRSGRWASRSWSSSSGSGRWPFSAPRIWLDRVRSRPSVS